MIYFYSGTPGSGKSFHAAIDIYNNLVLKKSNVISTIDLDINYLTNNGKRKIGNFLYIDIFSINPNFLVDYASRNHIPCSESQTLVVIDECQIIFNSREFSRKDRLSWITFFSQHRKLGYNFILISQFDRLIDRQIRSLFEYEIKHRKVNNFKFGKLIPTSVFVAITYWYGVREKVSVDFLIYKNKYGRIYNTFCFIDSSVKTSNSVTGFSSSASNNIQDISSCVGYESGRVWVSLPARDRHKNLLSIIVGYLKNIFC